MEDPHVTVTRPNILWYCPDSQRFDTIGALGNPYVHTPNLDRLVASGVAYTHAYCQSPVCTPSRASFLTGKYPSTVHVNGNGNGHFPPDERLVTRRLADVGYDCGLIGKLHLAGAYNGREARTDDGYRYFQYSHGPHPQWLVGDDYAAWLRSQGADPFELLDREPQRTGFLYEPTPEHDNVPRELHQTRWCSDRAIEFIEARRDGPWMLSVNPFQPHFPFNPPWEYYRRFDPDTMPGPYVGPADAARNARLAATDSPPLSARMPAARIPWVRAGGGSRDSDQEQAGQESVAEMPQGLLDRKIQAAYYAMVEQIDDEFGRILDVLDRTGQRENTLIVFTSDHGEALGDHGLVLKGCRFYEGLVRVPLVFSWPGRIEEGRQSDALVELVDIAPTLLDVAGLPIPRDMQGRSLQSMLRGEASLSHHRDHVRSEFYNAAAMKDGTNATMFRDRRWKLVTYHGHGLGELYDLETDPWEHHDLWDSPTHQEIKFDLLQRSFDAAIGALDRGPERVMRF